MPWLYLDTGFGVSGDMILGSLIDLGVDAHKLGRDLAAFLPEPFQLKAGPVTRSGIRAVQFAVECEPPAHGHRHAAEILQAIAGSPLPPRAQTRARRIVEVLARAEGRVHGIPPEEVSFHEVGAIDSIVDMIGLALALEELSVDGITAAPPALGHGTVLCQHGLYPVPAPATLYLLEGIPLGTFDAEAELTTPTGAAVVAALADRVGPFSGRRVLKVGYGAGSRVFPDHPNVLRAMLYEPSDECASTGDDASTPELVSHLAANIDDASGEILAHAADRLLQQGALDVWMTPVIMKKGRPGVVLNVLAVPAAVDELSRTIFQETTTLGVRVAGPMPRSVLAREHREVDLGYGRVPVKIGRLDGEVVQAAPEYAAVASLSEATGRPAKLVYQAALTAFWAENRGAS